jgi:opacity protein-like surface antigen
MTANQLATYAAIGIAAAALYVITRKPASAAVAAQGAAATKRSDDLRAWFDTSTQQWALFGGAGMPTSLKTSSSLTGF